MDKSQSACSPGATKPAVIHNRKQLEIDVAAFLADGGRIEQIPYGVSAYQENGKRRTQAEVRDEIKRVCAARYYTNGKTNPEMELFK